MDLITGAGLDVREVLRDSERADATPAKLKAALIPVRAFRTREKLGFRIVENLTQLAPEPDPFTGIQDGMVTRYRVDPLHDPETAFAANPAIEMIISAPATDEREAVTVKIVMDTGTLRHMIHMAGSA